jgi:uncharacterized protein (TIGR02996 family)
MSVQDMIEALLAECCSGNVSEQIVRRLGAIGRGTPGVVSQLIAAVTARTNDSEWVLWVGGFEVVGAVEWLIESLAEEGNATTILPTLAAIFDRSRRIINDPVYGNYEGAKELEGKVRKKLPTIFKSLCSAGTTTEEALLATILKDPHNVAAWQVYADWLEERGEPRSAYTRTRPALRRMYGNDRRYPALAKQAQDWLDAHGRGWADVYDAIELWQPDAETPTRPP